MRYDYDMIVLGGGAAGLTMSAIATRLGAKTLLVEQNRLGGDCTWTGCIPSKALLRAAHARRADFAQVMADVRAVRQRIYDDADAPEVFERAGVTVQRGTARFVDRNAVEITTGDKSQRVTGRYFTIATGATPRMPPVKGLDTVSYHTTDTIFEVTDLPACLGILGGGFAGVELAQAFARLGSTVILWEAQAQILPGADKELVQMLQAQLKQDGVQINAGTAVMHVSEARQRIAVSTEHANWHVDALLVVTGKRPAVQELDLKAAGVIYTQRGVSVSRRCRTNVRHIYAVGDVTGRYQFTHASEHMAKVAAANALLKLPLGIDTGGVPSVLFTDPELAHVGMTEAALLRKGIRYQAYRFPYDRLDRAIVDERPRGTIKVLSKPRTGKILGATILGHAAGELLCEFALAYRHGLTSIGIGRGLTAPTLPHHRAYGSVHGGSMDLSEPAWVPRPPGRACREFGFGLRRANFGPFLVGSTGFTGAVPREWQR